MSGQARPRQPIVEELEKQYDVVQVDASAPITETYDVLLAVQPSALGPEQMTNFVAAVKAGQPVAIFEDPLPALMTEVPGTSQPRRSPMGPMAMFGGGGAQPKGDINQLWDALGVRLAAAGGRPAMGQLGGGGPFIVCQDYNPHLKLELPSEFVFIDANLEGGGGDGGPPGFNQQQPIVSGLQEVLFPFPGAITRDESADVTFTPLVRTVANRTGTIEVDQVMGNRGDMRQLRIFERRADQSMVLAAAIERAAKPAPAAGSEPQEGEKPTASKPIRAVVVADIDLLDGRIFGLRSRPDEVFGLDFDNVEFALNVLDSLAGDDRFTDIRKRKPKHRTLERIEDAGAAAREDAERQRAAFIAEFDQAEREANDGMQKEVGEFEKKIRDMESQGDANPQAAMQAIQQLASRQRLAQRRLDTKIEQLKRKRDAEVDAVERKLESQIRREQDRQKWLAVLLPPILPLVLAFFVFFKRRAQEREGVAKSRLR
jgi:ABC-2 type transport system permease protein